MADREIDQNVVADVEYAELGPTIQRKVGERDDLGPDSATFIAAGDPIPPELRDLPRRAARAGSRSKK